MYVRVYIFLHIYIYIHIIYIYRKREREGQIGSKRERETDTARAKSRKNVNKAEQPEQGVGLHRTKDMTDVQRVFEVVELCRPGFLDHRTLVHRVNAPNLCWRNPPLICWKAMGAGKDVK